MQLKPDTQMPSQLPKKARNSILCLDEQFTQSKFVNLAPKSSVANTQMPGNLNCSHSVSSRLLPPMFKSSTKKNDDGFRILSCSGLSNDKVLET